MTQDSEIAVALDWTPNINHVGFFVAHARGYFSSNGVAARFLSPHSDSYKATPAQKLADGSAQIAVCPSESVISYACQNLKCAGPKLVAVAAVLAKDTSAIVTLQDSGISRPQELSGKRYASYGARYEGRIVQQMIKNDGGDGEYIEDTTMGMLGVWNTLLKGNADATWVFMAWEGVMAQLKGVSLNAFKLDDYQIAYGYSPVMAVAGDALDTNGPVIRKFLEAASKGWQDFVNDPETCAAEATEAMNGMFPDLPERVEQDVMVAGGKYLAPCVLPSGEGSWGKMDGSRWEQFLDWLSSSGLLTSKMQSRTPSAEKETTSLDGLRAGDVGDLIDRALIPADSLFSNSLLP